MNGNCLPVLEVDGRLSISVKRKHTTFWRGDTRSVGARVAKGAAQRHTRVL